MRDAFEQQVVLSFEEIPLADVHVRERVIERVLAALAEQPPGSANDAAPLDPSSPTTEPTAESLAPAPSPRRTEHSAERRGRLWWPSRRGVIVALVAAAILVALGATGLAETVVHYFSSSAPPGRVPRFNPNSPIPNQLNDRQHLVARQTRNLAAVRAGSNTYTIVASPIAGTRGRRACVWELIDRLLNATRGMQSCALNASLAPHVTHAVQLAGWVPPQAATVVYPIGPDSLHPVIPTWVIVGLVPAGARSVRVVFQDGTSASAQRNRGFFSYIVSGAHTRAGARPVGIVTTTRSGATQRQTIAPWEFDLATLRRDGEIIDARQAVRTSGASGVSGFPAGQGTEIVTALATRSQLHRLFGGPSASYPPFAGVVEYLGPFTINRYLGGCSYAAICPLRIGDWAWIAFLATQNLPTSPLAVQADVTWRVAGYGPIGSSAPDVAQVGTKVPGSGAPPPPPHWLRGRKSPPVGIYPGPVGPSWPPTIDNEYQGSLAFVTHAGEISRAGQLTCTWRHGHYTAALCARMSLLFAVLRDPRPTQQTTTSLAYTHITGTLGGWSGSLFLTTALERRLPSGLVASVRRALTRLHTTKLATPIPPLLAHCVSNPRDCPGHE